ncbi:MAG: hypothetical protein ACI4AK_05895 [Lepagella sp.]
MIIPNGTIEFKEKTPGKIDPETGYPSTSSQVAWSDPIPCQYVANNRTYLGKVNGERFTFANYVVFIDDFTPFPDSEQVRLKDKTGKDLGEYSLMSTEKYEAISQIKILI